MLQVQRDNTIIIHKSDAFSLLCASDAELDASKLFFYATNESNEIVIEKQAEKHENGIYFVFNSNDTNLEPTVYNYFVKYTIDEQNKTTILNSTLKVRRSI